MPKQHHISMTVIQEARPDEQNRSVTLRGTGLYSSSQSVTQMTRNATKAYAHMHCHPQTRKEKVQK